VRFKRVAQTYNIIQSNYVEKLLPLELPGVSSIMMVMLSSDTSARSR
jgi:hypothetical protein